MVPAFLVKILTIIKIYKNFTKGLGCRTTMKSLIDEEHLNQENGNCNNNLYLSFYMDTDSRVPLSNQKLELDQQMKDYFGEYHLNIPTIEGNEVIYRIEVPAVPIKIVMNDLFRNLLDIMEAYSNMFPHFTQIDESNLFKVSQKKD